MLLSSRSHFLARLLSLDLTILLVAGASNTITSPATLPTAAKAAQEAEQRRKDPAIDCWSSWSSYRSLSTSLYDSYLQGGSSFSTLPTFVETYSDIETVDYSNATFTQLCDGHSRLTTRFPTITMNSYSTYSDYVIFVPQSDSRTAKPPKCTFSRDSRDCSRVWSLWSSSSSALSSQSSDQPLSSLKSDGLPPCIEAEVPCSVIKDRQCTVKPDEGTMYYWPITTVSGDFCSQNGTTITPTPTKKGHPNTLDSGDLTFTSPSVYLVFSTLNGYYSSAGSGLLSRDGKCGPTVSDLTLTFPPSAVSSVGWRAPESGYSIDYSNFNTVQREAYANACPYLRACSGWVLSPWKNYDPFIQVPHAVLGKHMKNWGNCSGWAYSKPRVVRLEPGLTTTKKLGHEKPTTRPSFPRMTARPTPGAGRNDDVDEDEWRHNRQHLQEGSDKKG
ncbi:hypothetical protein BJ875DRAFT_547223 [Amylocarpus encephaloides]|uniref:Uncharacterized protein n=1 Tax=Amylocarpus encephaloides TaxID=45428 RepID=A0A9P7Y994_9HELO|nr:hypothetical protein BJ875DRAFT_547223 [Amylocarpus encephaloides]